MLYEHNLPRTLSRSGSFFALKLNRVIISLFAISSSTESSCFSIKLTSISDAVSYRLSNRFPLEVAHLLMCSYKLPLGIFSFFSFLASSKRELKVIEAATLAKAQHIKITTKKVTTELIAKYTIFCFVSPSISSPSIPAITLISTAKK